MRAFTGSSSAMGPFLVADGQSISSYLVKRIAGTWSYTGTPPPAITATNIVDGPLNISLAYDITQGSGMSPLGKVLYFIDAAGGNLLRVLKLCGRSASAPFRQRQRGDGLVGSGGGPRQGTMKQTNASRQKSIRQGNKNTFR